MTLQFTDYTEISCRALQLNPKKQEVITKKNEIFTAIVDQCGQSPESILYYGFNAMMLNTQNLQVFVTSISDEVKNWLDSVKFKYTYIDENNLKNYPKKFDWVVALDEFFTFGESEQQQKSQVEELVGLAKKMVVTTLRDYKNQDYRDREFSYPLAIKNNNEHLILLEYHDIDHVNKLQWTTTVYEMSNDNVTIIGPFIRQTMFFKQLAKFSIDAGAKNFYVHKNLMYKSVIKKNYEHVISINI